MNHPKIAILTCWYGVYPWYFPYFIHSCNSNKTIDFFILTDNQQRIPNKPVNVKILHKTLEEIKLTASQKLGFTVNLDYPYKLCDFKPAYGFLFPDILNGYDFWGHGDVDIVYGNVRNFITDDVLNNYDVINSRHDYVSGTFCLFKNIEQMNKLFMQSRDYKKVFSSAEHFCFDECNFLFNDLENGASIFDFTDNIQSMTYVVRKAEAEGKIRAYFDFIIMEGVPGKIKWENGRIIYKNKFEAMYYNLLRFKKECRYHKVLNPIPDIFYFTPTRILSKKKN
ncbi:DUF6625 family protein [Ferruginibacter sp.]|uniref:DUF6625 family protein n=1 Tax=Ferruginibacter sp. TaxID=1940288 RepID=UPI00265AD025|nr:DUF6625 family protein [Ferruginibacter sp.]